MKLFGKEFKGISIFNFYKWGSILFIVGAIGSAINTKIQWVNLNIGGKMSMLVTFFFQILLLALFLTLYFQMKKMPKQPEIINNPEVDDFLKKLQENDLKGGKNEQKNNIKN